MMDSRLAAASEPWFQVSADLVASGGRLVVDHLWQSTIFAFAILSLVRLLPKAPARLRYNLYLLAIIKFCLPSALVLGVLSRLPFAKAPWLEVGLLPEALRPWLDFGVVLASLRRLLGLGASAGGNALEHLPPALWWSLVACWSLVALTLGALWASRLLRLRAVVLRAREVVDGPVWRSLETGRRRLGLHRRVRLVTTREIAEPGVWGVLRPVIVLPAAMPRHLSGAELGGVLLHELLHVRRWDNLVGHGLLALRCLLWFHPLVWWLDRRTLAERELACDEQVVEIAGDRESYLRGLAKVLRFGAGWRLALPTGGEMSAASWSGASLSGGPWSGSGSSGVAGSDLGRRLRRLRQEARCVPSLGHRAIAATGGALLLLSSLAAGPLCAVDAPLRLMTRAANQMLAGGAQGGDGVEAALGLPSLSPSLLCASACPRSAASPTAVKKCDSRQDR